ncbi:MAG: OmpA family protein [Magnetococcales bacterium]|nr:OmpA family protein [Magnetococcales bacterium]MBF0309265.1 OmpA family protein [Magnetococcales bacterium]
MKKLVLSSAIALLVAGSLSTAEAGKEGWLYQGWNQWHPQMGQRPLSHTGTQFYFGTGEIGDEDGDGVLDDKDRCPGTPPKTPVDANGCPKDSDGDGVTDNLDQCPDTPRGVAVDKKGCPLDSDGDGVTDDRDQCPGTPAGVAVDAKGCPKEQPRKDGDSDGDGVLDSKDKCPGTPKGAKVNETGCWVLEDLHFDTDSAKVDARSHGQLDAAANVLKGNAALKVEIQGHTDDRGTDPYNMVLSKKRSEAVRNYLVGKGIAANRLSTSGFGESQPVAENRTAQGRAKNRRVTLKPVQ